MSRPILFSLLAFGFGLSCSTQAIGRQICLPALALKHVQLSQMHKPTLERIWTATLSVDASRCATKSGNFGLTLERLKENAPDISFHVPAVWQPDSLEVSVTFWADEAVQSYAIDNVATCPCSKSR